MLPRSYGGNSWFGKFHPAAGKELLASLPVAIKGLLRGKINLKIAIFGHKIPATDLKNVQRIYEKVESREERYELNLYITGYDEPEESQVLVGVADKRARRQGSGPQPGSGADGYAGGGRSTKDGPPQTRKRREGRGAETMRRTKGGFSQ